MKIKEKKRRNIIDKIIQLEDQMKSKKKKKGNITDKIMKLEDLILYIETTKERMTE